MNLSLEPPPHSPGLPGASRPLLRSKAPELSCCPCGQEVETLGGRHFLCAKHRQQVLRDVSRRFGSHRYGGRYADSVEDYVHDCYEKLLTPGVLDRFQPEPGRARADAFGAWLYRVVEYQCNNKLDYLQLRQTGEPADPAAEPAHAMTPDQAFAQKALKELVALAVADVQTKWKQSGSKKALRFEVFLSFINGEDDDYEHAQMILGVSNANAKKIKHDLGQEVLQAVRLRVRDTLYLEPGLTLHEIERRIDDEIKALLDAAFPPKAAEPCRPKAHDEKPEPTPAEPLPEAREQELEE